MERNRLIVELFHCVEILCNFTPVGCLVFFTEHRLDETKARKRRMLVFLDRFNECVSNFDQETIVQSKVFLQDSFIMVHNDCLENGISHIHHVYNLRKYL